MFWFKYSFEGRLELCPPVCLKVQQQHEVHQGAEYHVY